MKIIKQTLLIVALAFTTHSAFATVQSNCQGIYPNDERPDEVGTEVCFTNYAVVYSDYYKTALLSAIHLTKDDVDGANKIKRHGHFHSDSTVHSVNPKLYTDTGWDRGHLTNADTQPTITTEDETFDTVNVAPQAPHLNRVAWRDLETSINKIAEQYGDVYVYTSPLFIGTNIQKTNTGLPIPTQFSKVIYIPSTGECKAFVADNNNDADIMETSVGEFNRKYFHSYFADVCK